MLKSSHKICSNILRSPSYNLRTSPEIFCPSQYLIILSSSELFYFTKIGCPHITCKQPTNIVKFSQLSKTTPPNCQNGRKNSRNEYRLRDRTAGDAS